MFIIVHLVKIVHLLIKISKALPKYLKEDLLAEDVSVSIHQCWHNLRLNIKMVNTLGLEEQEIRNKIIDYLVENFPFIRKLKLDIKLSLSKKEEKEEESEQEKVETQEETEINEAEQEKEENIENKE